MKSTLFSCSLSHNFHIFTLWIEMNLTLFKTLLSILINNITDSSTINSECGRLCCKWITCIIPCPTSPLGLLNKESVHPYNISLNSIYPLFSQLLCPAIQKTSTSSTFCCTKSWITTTNDVEITINWKLKMGSKCVVRTEMVESNCRCYQLSN